VNAVESVNFESGSGAPRQIETLINRLGIPTGAGPGTRARWSLTSVDGALCLVERDRRKLKPLSVDFVKTRRKYRSLPISKQGPMARALGRSTRTVVDATAGWGEDMFLMWLMGYQVIAMERSLIIGALLLDGLARLRQYDPEPEYPLVEIGDALELLAVRSAECVYLDPMFPPRRKTSALAKRRLRVLRDLVGDDEDRFLLFDAAWQAASKRVVVKRPNHAPPWRNPDESFCGKIITYDLYLK